MAARSVRQWDAILMTMSDDEEEWKPEGEETKADTKTSVLRPSLDPECILPYAGVREDVEALLSRVRLEFDRNCMLHFGNDGKRRSGNVD